METLPPPGGGGSGGGGGPAQEEVVIIIEAPVVGEAGGNNQSILSRNAAPASAAMPSPPLTGRATTLAIVEAAEAELDKQATAVEHWSFAHLVIPGILAVAHRDQIIGFLAGRDDREEFLGNKFVVGAFMVSFAVPVSVIIAARSAVNNMRRRQIAASELGPREAVADRGSEEQQATAAAAARAAPPAQHDSFLGSPSTIDHAGVHHSAPVIGGVLPRFSLVTQEGSMPPAVISDTENSQCSSSSSSSSGMSRRVSSSKTKKVGGRARKRGRGKKGGKSRCGSRNKRSSSSSSSSSDGNSSTCSRSSSASSLGILVDQALESSAGGFPFDDACGITEPSLHNDSKSAGLEQEISLPRKQAETQTENERTISREAKASIIKELKNYNKWTRQSSKAKAADRIATAREKMGIGGTGPRSDQRWWWLCNEEAWSLSRDVTLGCCLNMQSASNSPDAGSRAIATATAAAAAAPAATANSTEHGMPLADGRPWHPMNTVPSQPEQAPDLEELRRVTQKYNEVTRTFDRQRLEAITACVATQVQLRGASAPEAEERRIDAMGTITALRVAAEAKADDADSTAARLQEEVVKEFAHGNDEREKHAANLARSGEALRTTFGDADKDDFLSELQTKCTELRDPGRLLASAQKARERMLAIRIEGGGWKKERRSQHKRVDANTKPEQKPIDVAAADEPATEPRRRQWNIGQELENTCKRAADQKACRAEKDKRKLRVAEQKMTTGAKADEKQRGEAKQAAAAKPSLRDGQQTKPLSTKHPTATQHQHQHPSPFRCESPQAGSNAVSVRSQNPAPAFSSFQGPARANSPVFSVDQTFRAELGRGKDLDPVPGRDQEMERKEVRGGSWSGSWGDGGAAKSGVQPWYGDPGRDAVQIPSATATRAADPPGTIDIADASSVPKADGEENSELCGSSSDVDGGGGDTFRLTGTPASTGSSPVADEVQSKFASSSRSAAQRDLPRDVSRTHFPAGSHPTLTGGQVGASPNCHPSLFSVNHPPRAQQFLRPPAKPAVVLSPTSPPDLAVDTSPPPSLSMNQCFASPPPLVDRSDQRHAIRPAQGLIRLSPPGFAVRHSPPTGSEAAEGGLSSLATGTHRNPSVLACSPPGIPMAGAGCLELPHSPRLSEALPTHTDPRMAGGLEQRLSGHPTPSPRVVSDGQQYWQWSGGSGGAGGGRAGEVMWSGDGVGQWNSNAVGNDSGARATVGGGNGSGWGDGIGVAGVDAGIYSCGGGGGGWTCGGGSGAEFPHAPASLASVSSHGPPDVSLDQRTIYYGRGDSPPAAGGAPGMESAAIDSPALAAPATQNAPGSRALTSPDPRPCPSTPGSIGDHGDGDIVGENGGIGLGAANTEKVDDGQGAAPSKPSEELRDFLEQTNCMRLLSLFHSEAMDLHSIELIGNRRFKKWGITEDEMGRMRSELSKCVKCRAASRKMLFLPCNHKMVCKPCYDEMLAEGDPHCCRCGEKVVEAFKTFFL